MNVSITEYVMLLNQLEQVLVFLCYLINNYTNVGKLAINNQTIQSISGYLKTLSFEQLAPIFVNTATFLMTKLNICYIESFIFMHIS